MTVLIRPTQLGELFASDGMRLHFETFEPKHCRRQMLLCHGYAEHCGRYDELTAALVAADTRVVRFDLRGHGRSGGTRGAVRVFEDYFCDIDAARTKLDPEQPTLLFGHSLGGLIASHYAATHPTAFAGLVLSSPYFVRAIKANPLKVAAGHVLGRVAPGLALPSGLGAEMLMRDPEKVANWKSDPFLFPEARAGWFVQVSARQAASADVVVKLQMPILWLHGSADPVAEFEGSRRMFERAESRDKRFLSVENGLHEPLNDVGREALVKEIVDFSVRIVA